MYDFHTTKDGQSMMICMMEDSHLVNTIKLYLRKMQEQVLILKGVPNLSVDVILSAVQPIDTQKLQKTAKEQIRLFNERLAPYVMEATLRGLNELFIKEMQAVYGRSGKIDADQILGLAATQKPTGKAGLQTRTIAVGSYQKDEEGRYQGDGEYEDDEHLDYSDYDDHDELMECSESYRYGL